MGSPLFDKVMINFENGNKLKIVAINNSRENRYIQEMKLNGNIYEKTFLLHKDLVAGGILEFTMVPDPNRSWATEAEARPYSLSNVNNLN